MRRRPSKKKKTSGILSFAFFLALFFSFLALLAYYNVPVVGPALRQIAGPFFAEKISPEDIKRNYQNGKVKILIVPGHDNDSYGARYKAIKEATLNAELGNNLFDYLKNEEKFETLITRNRSGGYQDWFWNYLEGNEGAIREFRRKSREIMAKAVSGGNVTESNTVYHNEAADLDSLKLYAVNKWANENNIDIVFHIHFNDYPGRNINRKGEYSGFSVYIPERQLPNHRSSSELARSLKFQLEKYFSKSDLPQEKESDALIEDQELIAVGSNASRDGASVLIEYGYIYEAPLEKKEPRAAILKELSFQTYMGVKNFFDDGQTGQKHETTLLPHKWSAPLQKGMVGEKDVLALQMALYKEGVYPPLGKSFSDCPVNGVFGNCTLASVMSFQEKYREDILLPQNQKESTGRVGPATLLKLNELYGE